ncbi:hypothetical protein PV328_009313 [Microctonus aethiopoides]|uniref:Uncharacterized protein n=1 Tax=Microctonus aethiopoides TaxID=144406 RepID=A0AA39C5H4_9HYME|nr:hypothetical protein PV328_009313 [Microctonus aethiopoides]
MRGLLIIFIVAVGISCEAASVSTENYISLASGINDEDSIEPIYSTNRQSNSAFRTYSIPTYPEYVPVKSHSNVKNNEQTNSNIIESSSHIPLENWSSTIARSLVPLSSFALFFGAKAVIYTLKFIAIAIISLGLTTIICTFTPLCRITFPRMDLDNKNLIAKLATPYINAEDLNQETVTVSHAIDAFKEIQNHFKNITGSEENER